MDVLASHIRTDTNEYQANRERMTALVAGLQPANVLAGRFAVHA